MIEKGNIEKSFSESFQNFEADVDASVWNAIENNLQTPVPIPTQPISTGLSIGAKTIIGLVAASAITISIFYFSQDKKENAVVSGNNLKNQLSNSTEQSKENVPLFEDESKTVIENVEQEVGKPKTENRKPKTEIISANNDDKIISKDAPPVTETTNGKTIEEAKQTNNTAQEKTESQSQNSESQHNNTTAQQPNNTITNQLNNSKPYQPFPFKYNIITPNGDGMNDIYSLEAEGLNILSIEAFILGANSTIICRISNLNGYWDGKDLKGNLAPIGEYRIIVSATGADGTNYKGQKQITLNR